MVEREKPEIQAKIKIIDEGKTAEEQAKILSELEFAQKGDRIHWIEYDGTPHAIGVDSSFPQWVPGELRNRKLFDSVLEHIKNDTSPKKADEVRLYNIIADKLGLIQANKEIGEEINVEDIFAETYEEIRQISPVEERKVGEEITRKAPEEARPEITPAIPKELETTLNEFSKLPPGEKIVNPEGRVLINKTKDSIASVFGVSSEISASRLVIKHISERRIGKDARIIPEMPEIIANPTHIIPNYSMQNRIFKPDSYLFVKTNGKAEIVIVEINKKANRFEVITAMLKRIEQFNGIQKAVLDAGGTAFRTNDGISLIVSPADSKSLAASLSALQRQKLLSSLSIAKAKEAVKGVKEVKPEVPVKPEAEEALGLAAKKWEVKMAAEPEIAKTINKTEIMTWAEKTFKVPLKMKATYKWRQAGVYYPKSQIVRMAKRGKKGQKGQKGQKGDAKRGRFSFKQGIRHF